MNKKCFLNNNFWHRKLTLKTQNSPIWGTWNYVNSQNTAISFWTIHLFDRIKLILYLQIKNSRTQLISMYSIPVLGHFLAFYEIWYFLTFLAIFFGDFTKLHTCAYERVSRGKPSMCKSLWWFLRRQGPRTGNWYCPGLDLVARYGMCCIRAAFRGSRPGWWWWPPRQRWGTIPLTRSLGAHPWYAH